MRGLRHLARTNNGIALLFVLLALAVRLAVPAGYMPAHDARGATMILCSGQVAEMPAESMPAESMASAGSMASHMPMHHVPVDGGHNDMPCGFAGLAIVAGGGELPAVVPAVVAYAPVADVALKAVATVRATPRLRPPLRAPPVAQA